MAEMSRIENDTPRVAMTGIRPRFEYQPIHAGRQAVPNPGRFLQPHLDCAAQQ